jgi:hypothetical protein
VLRETKAGPVWYDLAKGRGKVQLCVQFEQVERGWEVSQLCEAFVSNFVGLDERSIEAADKRGTHFADAGGENGRCSFAEIIAWIKSRVGLRLFKAFKPCFIRAFLDAADIAPERKIAGLKKGDTDDFVQRSEFRLLCTYLMIYARMFDAFACIDGKSAGITATDDREIALDEWNAGWQKLNATGFHAFSGIAKSNEMDIHYRGAEERFNEMDVDGKGSIFLAEWCVYIKETEIKQRTRLGELLSIGDED